MTFPFFKQKKITLSQIIGGLTRSILKAQEAATLHMLDTINELSEEEGNALKPKYILFKDQEKYYNLPLLSIIPLSHMSINEADLEFDAKILDVVSDKTYSDEESLKKYNVEYDPIKIHISYNDDKSNLHVKIKLKNNPLPQKLRDYLNSLEHTEKQDEQICHSESLD